MFNLGDEAVSVAKRRDRGLVVEMIGRVFADKNTRSADVTQSSRTSGVWAETMTGVLL